MKNPTRLTTAVLDMGTAYTDAAGRPNPDVTELRRGDISGMTLTPGLYKWSSGVSLHTDVTLSGSENDVFIFQIAGNLIQSNGVSIHLQGGAQAKNVFWQVAGLSILGTTSHFEGIILCKTLIAVQTHASINGRLLSQTAVTLQMNSVTQPAQ
jgi:Ice-binding-like